MKDYDNVILWLDYYNKGISRAKGRKVSKSLAIYDPSISELKEAAISLGYEISPDQLNDTARFPRRPHIKSGYIMISKNSLIKNKVIKTIAEKMIHNRSKQKK
jgi:signal recognition particle subunit SRP19